MSIFSQLWFMWLAYWVSGAIVGSFIGTLLALGAHAKWNKIKAKE